VLWEAINASLHLSFRAVGYERATEQQEEVMKAFPSSKDVLVSAPDPFLRTRSSPSSARKSIITLSLNFYFLQMHAC
jgi:hypothetical protein